MLDDFKRESDYVKTMSKAYNDAEDDDQPGDNFFFEDLMRAMKKANEKPTIMEDK